MARGSRGLSDEERAGLANLRQALRDWALVDYGEKRWGEKYTEAQEITGLAYDSLQRYAQVALRFPIPERLRKLSFEHHKELGSVTDLEAQERWLTQAEEEGWSKGSLRQQLRHGSDESSRPPQLFAGKGDKFYEVVEPALRYVAAGRFDPRCGVVESTI